MNKMLKKTTVVFLFFLVVSSSFGQILREGFDNNSNGWEIEKVNKDERAAISNGRYNLNVPDRTNWHYFTIPRAEDRKEFLLETVITKMPREISYQKINIEYAVELLNSKNYKNKDLKSIYSGLIELNEIQESGARFFFDNNKQNYSYYFYTGKISEEMKSALSFIYYNQDGTLYDDSMYGLIFGGRQNSNLFAFNILPEFQMFQVISLINGTLTEIIDWTTSYSLKKGNSTNKLSLLKGEDYWHFLINEELAGKAPAQQFFGNEIGFFVGPETNISVDYINFLYKSDQEANSIDTSPNVASEFSSSGSGFLISDKGYFVTNYHVIENAKEVWIDSKINGSTKSSKAKVVVSDKNNDLAIIKVEGMYNLPQPVYGFNPNTVDVGTTIFAMGYPLLGYMGDEVKITDGIISSKTGFQGDISLYQISAPIQPGNSGGALFDKLGNLVGITNAGIPDAQNVGYAIKASYLKNLIELLPERVVLNSDSRISSLTFTEQIKRLQEFIVIVKVKE